MAAFATGIDSTRLKAAPPLCRAAKLNRSDSATTDHEILSPSPVRRLTSEPKSGFGRFSSLGPAARQEEHQRGQPQQEQPTQPRDEYGRGWLVNTGPRTPSGQAPKKLREPDQRKGQHRPNRHRDCESPTLFQSEHRNDLSDRDGEGDQLADIDLHSYVRGRTARLSCRGRLQGR